jgi:hypothetical protein
LRLVHSLNDGSLPFLANTNHNLENFFVGYDTLQIKIGRCSGDKKIPKLYWHDIVDLAARMKQSGIPGDSIVYIVEKLKPRIKA